MPWTREENIFRHNLFGEKIIQNCHKIDASHWYNNDLLLRQETQKSLHILEADMINLKKRKFSFDVFCLKMDFWTSSKWPPLRLSQ